MWHSSGMYAQVRPRVCVYASLSCDSSVTLPSCFFQPKLHGAAYGKGIYLSPISSISFGYSGRDDSFLPRSGLSPCLPLCWLSPLCVFQWPGSHAGTLCCHHGKVLHAVLLCCTVSCVHFGNWALGLSLTLCAALHAIFKVCLYIVAVTEFVCWLFFSFQWKGGLLGQGKTTTLKLRTSLPLDENTFLFTKETKRLWRLIPSTLLLCVPSKTRVFTVCRWGSATADMVQWNSC